MHYDEFLKRLERLGQSDISIATEAGYADPKRTTDGWKRHGVPKTIAVLLRAWETIEFLQAAIREMNRRVVEIEVHTKELMEAGYE